MQRVLGEIKQPISRHSLRALRPRSGGFVFLAMLLLSSLSLLGILGLNSSLVDSRLNSMAVGGVSALAAAEAGIERALWEYNHNGGSFSTWSPPLVLNGECPTEVSCRQRLFQVWPEETETEIPPEATATVIVQAWNTLNPTVRSTGRLVVPGTSTQLTVTLQRATPFQDAIFSTTNSSTITGVQVYNGAIVDSYKSESGAYGAMLNPSDATYGALNQSQFGFSGTYGATLRTHSLRVTNGSSTGAIAVYTWNPKVFGSVYAPDPANIVQDSFIFGTKGVQPSRSFEAISVPTAPAPSDCTDLGDLVVTTTPSPYAGTQYCANSIVVDAGGILQFPNLKQLYVTGDTTVTNGGRMLVGQGLVRTDHLKVTKPNSTFEGTQGRIDLYANQVIVDQSLMKAYQESPMNLRVYIPGPPVGSDDSFGLYNSATFYGLLYAPQGDMNLTWKGISSNNHFYGAAIVAWAYVYHNSQFHFDESVKTVADWPAWMRPVRVTSWRRDRP